MEVMVSFIVGLVVLYVILKVLSLPFKIIWKLFLCSRNKKAMSGVWMSQSN